MALVVLLVVIGHGFKEAQYEEALKKDTRVEVSNFMEMNQRIELWGELSREFNVSILSYLKYFL